MPLFLEVLYLHIALFITELECYLILTGRNSPEAFESWSMLNFIIPENTDSSAYCPPFKGNGSYFIAVKRRNFGHNSYP